jgi:hypothetical protein
VTRLPTPDAVDIESVKYETIGTGAAQAVKATIKVTDLTVIPQGTFWRASFAANCPFSVLNPTGEYTFGISDDGDQFFLQANTTDEGVQSFEYGKAVRNPDGSITHTTLGAADGGAFNQTNRTITIEVTLAKLNAVLAAANRPLLAPGSVVAGLRARAVTADVNLPPPAGRQGRRDPHTWRHAVRDWRLVNRAGEHRLAEGARLSRNIRHPASTDRHARHREPQWPARRGPASGCRHIRQPCRCRLRRDRDSPSGGNVSNVSVSGNVVTVDLSGVGNAQTITINLLGVTDGSNRGNVAIPMSVLLGDATANRDVNASDVSQAKSFSGMVTTGANFRNDITVNGVINTSDIGIIKANSGTGLGGAAPSRTATETR